MRAIAAVAAAAVGASLLAISAPTGVGAAPTVTEQTRIAGADRYATANAVALAAVGTRTNVTSVVIASGENFPDGLAASALAGALNAPMLLTQSAALPTSVLATLTTIRATNANLTNAVLVGGTSVISADIATQLTAIGMTVTRIAGDTRYATANAVAAATRTNNSGTIGTFGGYRTAFLANGNNFPDALAASSWAYKNKHPLFLTNGTSVDADTVAAMIAAGVQQVIILGGTSAVSAEVATAVAGVTGVITTTRVSGDTRYDTATALATVLATVDAGFKTNAMLVSGTNFPDALSAAQLAGGTTAYAIVPVTSPLPAAVSTWLTANQSTLTTIRAIGGTEAVPADIVTEVKAGATTAPLTATIAAVDGATTATVTFSGAVGATGADIASYAVRSAAGAVKTLAANPNGAVLNTTPAATANTVATLTLASGVFQPGDVISIVTGAIGSAADSSLKVATASFTVVANTAAPVATLVAYSGATFSASALPKVWVSFDVAVNGFDCAADLRRTGQTIGSTAETYFATGTEHVTGKVYSCVVATGKAAMTAGDTVTLLASGVTSSASTPVGNAATSTTVVADTTAPSITSARFAQTAAGGTQASRSLGLSSAGNVVVSAKVGGALDGKAGNAVTVGVVEGAQFAGAETCVYTAASNTVTISASATSSASAVQAACALSSSAASVVSVTVTSGDLTGLTSGSLGLMTGGADLVTITLAFSEAINPSSFTGTQVTFGSLTATAVGFATPLTAATQLLANGAVITATTAGTVLAGVSTVALTAAVTDRNSNAAGTTGVALTPAS